MENGLKDIAFYVKNIKHIGQSVITFRWIARSRYRGTRICKTGLFHIGNVYQLSGALKSQYERSEWNIVKIWILTLLVGTE